MFETIGFCLKGAQSPPRYFAIFLEFSTPLPKPTVRRFKGGRGSFKECYIDKRQKCLESKNFTQKGKTHQYSANYT